MADPQGNATFPGIKVLAGWNFTMNEGITPSSGLIRTVPHTKFIATVGDFTMTYGGQTITLHDCALDDASLSIDPSGQWWTIRVLDRRWKWTREGGGGTISGRYNIKLPDGTIRAGTQKTPQELAKLLLTAMGEDTLDINKMPNDARPEVLWDDDLPAEALARLCDELRCRIFLRDKSVVIEPLDQGQGIGQYSNGKAITASFGFDTKVGPDEFEAVGQPILYEVMFELEAVGLDEFGALRPLKALKELKNPELGGRWYDRAFEDIPVEGEAGATYKDKDGNEKQYIDLAEQTYYRYYRIKRLVGDKPPPIFQGKVDNVNQYLPLLNHLVDETWNLEGDRVHAPAEVHGLFSYDDDPDQQNQPWTSKYAQSYQIDTDRGLVIFNDPVVAFGWVRPTPASSLAWSIMPAKLFLKCTVAITDKDTGVKDRYRRTKQRNGPKNVTPKRIIKNDDLQRKFKQAYTPTNPFVAFPLPYDYTSSEATTLGVEVDAFTYELGKSTDNEKEVNDDADEILKAVEREYLTDEAVTLTLSGLVYASLSGKIAQITWSGGNGRPTTTTISQNRVHEVYAPSPKERRRAERNKAAHEAAAFIEKGAKAVAGAVWKFFGGA